MVGMEPNSGPLGKRISVNESEFRVLLSELLS